MSKLPKATEPVLLTLSWLVLSANGIGFLWFLPDVEDRAAQGVMVAMAAGSFVLAWVLHKLVKWVFTEDTVEIPSGQR